MKKIIIEGNNILSGKINISGAKNSVLALIPACLLSKKISIISNVPKITDVDAIEDIMRLLNVKIEFKNNIMIINPQQITNQLIPEEKSEKLRASYYFMGALLAKYKKTEMYFPGGCNIGTRPIDIHIKGFKKLGVDVNVEGNKYCLTAKRLIGTRIYLDFASVGATINLMYVATLAEGTTHISNAAKEPEIINVADFLNSMGAKIMGAGTDEIIIEGVKELNGGEIRVIPDRIEASTFIILGALLGDNIIINGVIPHHFSALLLKLKEMGVKYQVKGDNIIISQSKILKPINIKTLVYPGLATDIGQPMSVLLTQANGTSLFEETIYENRMGHAHYLNKMGADIIVENQKAIIKGPTKLKGTEVISTDLRAGASLIIAGLIAEGTTSILNAEHILRGYQNIVYKLKKVGAKISIKEIK